MISIISTIILVNMAFVTGLLWGWARTESKISSELYRDGTVEIQGTLWKATQIER